jgi:superfamily II DNA or RNA helicase
VFIIIDEYHNLSTNNLTNKSDPINKLLESENPILFLSATPIEQSEKNKYFGQTTYKYSWTKAIQNKYICDFKIIIPETKSYVEYFKNMLNDLNYSESDIKLVNKAYFLLRSILYEGSSKCIVYLTSISNAELFGNIIIWIQQLLNIKVNTYQIDCLTAKTKRAEYINKFKSDTNLSLLLNVQILNEGIDIPICDSVFITDPNNNIENLVQRMSRANRICLTKTECQIYMYCNEKKISKVLDYINANTNNELKNKIYRIRFDNKTKPIETKYIEQLTNDLNLNISLKQYLKDNSTVDHKFIDDFYSFYDEGQNENDYVINIEKLSNWLEIKKENLKRLLENNFEKDKDYIIKEKIKGVGKGIGKNNRKCVMLSYVCSKLLCMISKSPKSSVIKKFYIDLDIIITKRNL